MKRNRKHKKKKLPDRGGYKYRDFHIWKKRILVNDGRLKTIWTAKRGDLLSANFVWFHGRTLTEAQDFIDLLIALHDRKRAITG